MFKNIRRLKELSREVEAVTNSNEGEEKAELCVYCDSIEDALSPFCGKESPVINSDLADYLENKAHQLPIGEDIHIKLTGEADKEVLKKAIKNYYGNKLVDAKREFKKNGILSIIFTLCAIVVLTVAVLMSVLWDTHLVLQEIVDIVGWVFMWEAVDMFFLERGSLRIKQIRYLNFMRADVK